MTSFYPHSNKFKYSKEGKSETIDLNTESAHAKELEADGWERSTFPISSAGAKTYANEEELRSDMKWDTVDCRTETKLTDMVYNPTFQVHALNRGNRIATRKQKFALIVSVDMTEKSIDLYSQIVAKYPALVPINLNVQVPIQVQAAN